MRSKKILTLILAIVLVAVLGATLAGCAVSYTTEEGFKDMTACIDNSLTQKTYFVKENKYNYKQSDGTTESTGTLEIRMNVHEDDPDTEIDDTRSKYTETFVKALALDNTYFYEWSYGPSLPKAIKPKKAKVEDYKYYMFVAAAEKMAKSDVMTRKLATFEEYKQQPKVSDYVIEKVLDDLKALTLDNMTDYKASKKGVVTTYTFTVNKAGHAYHGKNMKIQSMYDKISLIEAVNVAKASDFKIDITYVGPKVNIINYDGQYNDKDIVEI